MWPMQTIPEVKTEESPSVRCKTGGRMRYRETEAETEVFFTEDANVFTKPTSTKKGIKYFAQSHRYLLHLRTQQRLKCNVTKLY